MKVKSPLIRSRRIPLAGLFPTPHPLPRGREMDTDRPGAPDSRDGGADHELDVIGVEQAAAEPIQMRNRERKHQVKSDLPIPSRGSGRHLPSETREKMERSFGHDFSAVRVHEGSEPARIGADAYTRGNNIHFAPGAFHPSSPDGEQLLGHELAHVVQQRAGRVRAPLGTGAPINTDAALEAEADALGSKAADGGEAKMHGGSATAAAPESAPIQMGRRKQRKEGTPSINEKKKERKKKERKKKSKKKESLKESRSSIKHKKYRDRDDRYSEESRDEKDEVKNDKKRKREEPGSNESLEDRPKKKVKHEEKRSSEKKKNVKKTPKKVVDDFIDDYDDDDKDFVDEETMTKQLNEEYDDEYDERTGKKKPTLREIYPEMKQDRTMVLPQQPDFYHQFFSHEKTGPLLRNYSERTMTQYNNNLTKQVTPKKLTHQSNYIAESMHKGKVKNPEKYYDTQYDIHALALDKVRNNLRKPKKNEDLDPEKSSTPWRQPLPGIRYQPSGSFVTSFNRGDDYDSITKELQDSVDRKELTTEQIGTILNQPTPKVVRNQLEKIDTLKNLERTNRDNYMDSEEMPTPMNYLYNLGYTDRSVEVQRNPSIGPFLGVRNTQISKGSISLQDAFSKKGKSGLITYVGSGTNTNSSKGLTNDLIGLSMSQIEHQNLRDTNLGETSLPMVGTDLDLMDRGMVVRNLAKSYSDDWGLKRREGTPEPPPRKEVEQQYMEELGRSYGSINNRGVMMKNGKLVLEEEDFQKKDRSKTQKKDKDKKR